MKKYQKYLSENEFWKMSLEQHDIVLFFLVDNPFKTTQMFNYLVIYADHS